MNHQASKKVKSYNFGLFAESLAALFLNLQGYRILERRYKTHLGEIDLVAKRGRNLVFIEVKARKKKETSEVLSQHQMNRISKAGLLFLAKNNEFEDYFIRFDLIIMRPFSWPEHFKNAWECRQ